MCLLCWRGRGGLQYIGRSEDVEESDWSSAPVGDKLPKSRYLVSVFGFAPWNRGWLRLHEKGGKRHDVPAHHPAAAALDA